MVVIPRSPRLPDRMLMSFDLECGALFPGHRVILRGLVDDGLSSDDLTSRDQAGHVECQMVSLSYEVVPGVTRQEAAQREPGTSFSVDATFGTDVPLPWSTGGSGPDGLAGPSQTESYDELVWGGQSTLGELGPWPVPAAARHLTFWLHSVDGDCAGTVTVDLVTKAVEWQAR